MNDEATVMDPVPASVRIPKTEDPTPNGPLKVLLIEDNQLDARLIQIMLAESGAGRFELERVDRLSSGLARLAKGDISMVLLDLSLPDSHGLRTFATAHAKAPRIPIIVMSGMDDQNMAVQAVHEGAQDYLVKGQVTGPLLVRAMRYALERVRTAEQLACYAEELHERNALMEADLNMAREIQQVFLPHDYPSFPWHAAPNQSALRFYHRYLPAAAVSGDFFNIFRLSDTSAGIFVCDVMGHGMRAALVTAIMRGLVEELLPVAAEPGQFLSEINKTLLAIFQRTDQPMLATAVYVILDAEQGEMRFCSAGHPSPVLVSRKLHHAERLNHYDRRHGPALGLFGNSSFPVCTFPLSARDLVFFFTDGLYEVNGPKQEEYGQERLLHAIQNRVHLSSEQLFDELLAEVQDFSLQKEFEDDVCLVAAEMTHLQPKMS
jgi:phosphoserine phosphatase RsbU/P